MSWAKLKTFIPLGIIFLAAFAVFCKIHYSDGDDAFFDSCVKSMSFLDYLKERYLTWTGRVGGETAIYITFTLGIWFWRVVNAFMVTALPTLVFLTVKKFYPGVAGATPTWSDLRLFLLTCSGFLLMDIVTCGHGAIWISGSVFYTWALVSALACIYLTLDFFTGGSLSTKKILASIPFGLFALTSIEQIALLLLAYFIGGISLRIIRKEKIPAILYVELAIFLTTFAIVLAAPGNSLRITAEAEAWFPTFKALPLGERAFISVQWLTSSFANEGKILFLLIWIATLFSATPKSKPTIVATALFSAVAILPLAGITALADTGISYIDPAVQPEVFPSIANATALNFIAMAWWLTAAAFTLFLIYKYLGKKGASLFTVAILCEAMMFFSPTIYASGERVFFVTDWILAFIILSLFSKITSEKHRNIFFSVALILAVLNVLQFSVQLKFKTFVDQFTELLAGL
jgi:hypothetical protein